MAIQETHSTLWSIRVRHVGSLSVNRMRTLPKGDLRRTGYRPVSLATGGLIASCSFSVNSGSSSARETVSWSNFADKKELLPQSNVSTTPPSRSSTYVTGVNWAHFTKSHFLVLLQSRMRNLHNTNKFFTSCFHRYTPKTPD